MFAWLENRARTHEQVREVVGHHQPTADEGIGAGSVSFEDIEAVLHTMTLIATLAFGFAVALATSLNHSDLLEGDARISSVRCSQPSDKDHIDYLFSAYHLRSCMLTLLLSLSCVVTAVTTLCALYLSGARGHPPTFAVMKRTLIAMIVACFVMLISSMCIFFSAVYTALVLLYPMYEWPLGTPECSLVAGYRGTVEGVKICQTLHNASLGIMVELNKDSETVRDYGNTIYTGLAQALAVEYLKWNIAISITVPLVLIAVFSFLAHPGRRAPCGQVRNGTQLHPSQEDE